MMSTIFIKHHDYNIKENGKFLNKFFSNKKQAEKRVAELQELNPDATYEIKYIGDDVNDLKMRIVEFLERFCLPKYIMEIDGVKLHKIFNVWAEMEMLSDEIREDKPNCEIKITKIANGKSFPEYVSLEQIDYDLLKEDGKISKNNTVFGLKVKVDDKKVGNSNE